MRLACVLLWSGHNAESYRTRTVQASRSGVRSRTGLVGMAEFVISRQPAVDNFSSDVRQAEVAALMASGQFQVIEAEQMQ